MALEILIDKRYGTFTSGHSVGCSLLNSLQRNPCDSVALRQSSWAGGAVELQLGGSVKHIGVTSLLSVLRSEKKRIEQAIRNPEDYGRDVGRQTHSRHGAFGRFSLAESVTGLERYILTDTLRNIKTVPIRRDILASDESRQVANLAYDLWLATEFRGGSPEEALFTAVRQLRRTTPGLFLVPRRTPSLPFCCI